MKNYYDFMFPSTVCSSFKGFKCKMQSLEHPQKLLEICQTQKYTGNFAKLSKNSSKNC